MFNQQYIFFLTISGDITRRTGGCYYQPMEIHTVQEENQSMAVSERVSGYSEMMNDGYVIA